MAKKKKSKHSSELGTVALPVKTRFNMLLSEKEDEALQLISSTYGLSRSDCIRQMIRSTELIARSFPVCKAKRSR